MQVGCCGAVGVQDGGGTKPIAGVGGGSILRGGITGVGWAGVREEERVRVVDVCVRV